jgi:hypothetical protein
MSAESTSDNVNILLSKLMTDRFCSGEASDFDACIQNFVPQRVDNSYIDQHIQRKGLKKCEPYKEVVQRCMQDEKKQTAILKAAAKAPTCNDERKRLAQCQRKGNSQCEAEALESVMCGLVYLAQKQRKGAASTELPA